MEKISIIIPAHNEEKRIGKTLEEYLKYFRILKKTKKIDFEIIVVLNACEDHTKKVVEMYKCKELIILDFKEGGKGFAIIEGFKDSLKRKNNLIGFVDGDMATSPDAFYDLIKNIGNYGGIIGSRYVKGSIVSPPPSFSRIISSRIFNIIIRVLFLLKYRDTQCGAKVFKKETIEIILPKIGITKWAFDVDLIYQIKKENINIREYPTCWSDKEYSKINLKRAGPSMFLAVIRLRIINSHFKKIVEVYNKYTKNKNKE